MPLVGLAAVALVSIVLYANVDTDSRNFVRLAFLSVLLHELGLSIPGIVRFVDGIARWTGGLLP